MSCRHRLRSRTPAHGRAGRIDPEAHRPAMDGAPPLTEATDALSASAAFANAGTWMCGPDRPEGTPSRHGWRPAPNRSNGCPVGIGCVSEPERPHPDARAGPAEPASSRHDGARPLTDAPHALQASAALPHSARRERAERSSPTIRRRRAATIAGAAGNVPSPGRRKPQAVAGVDAKNRGTPAGRRMIPAGRWIRPRHPPPPACIPDRSLTTRPIRAPIPPLCAIIGR